MNAPSTPANSTSNGRTASWSTVPSSPSSFSKEETALVRGEEEEEDIDISEDEREVEARDKRGFKALKKTPVNFLPRN